VSSELLGGYTTKNVYNIIDTPVIDHYIYIMLYRYCSPWQSGIMVLLEIYSVCRFSIYTWMIPVCVYNGTFSLTGLVRRGAYVQVIRQHWRRCHCRRRRCMSVSMSVGLDCRSSLALFKYSCYIILYYYYFIWSVCICVYNSQSYFAGGKGK